MIGDTQEPAPAEPPPAAPAPARAETDAEAVHRKRGRTAMVRARLQEMKTECAAGSLIVANRDGLCLASAMRKGADEGRMAALTASTLQTSSRNGQTFEIGDYLYTIIKGTKGLLVVMKITGIYLLGVHTSNKGNLAMIMEHMERACEDLRRILSN